MGYVTERNKSRADPKDVRNRPGPGDAPPMAGRAERRVRPRSERARAAILAATDRLLEAGSVRELTIEADAPVREAILRLDADGLRHLVVVEGERVLGVLSSRDIPVLELGSAAEQLHERRRPAGRLENGSAAYA